MSLPKRNKVKNRAQSGSFFALPHVVMASPGYRGLSAHAVKLLCDLGGQYRGYNNGDLSATWKIMHERGWKSRETLDRALRELRKAGMIELTRQGGMNQCSLYALTWHTIDACGGKLDVPATSKPSSLWMRAAEEKQNASTATVSTRHAGRVVPTRQPYQSSDIDTRSVSIEPISGHALTR